MKTENFHFIGIGGIGMSALAKILLEKNIKVSGSDIAKNSLIKNLQKKGAKIEIGHNKKSIKKDSIVVYSSAIDEENEEIKIAKKMGCTLLHRSELLEKLMSEKKALLVSGTHGKTTTTSLLTTVFMEAKKDPSFVVGGVIKNYQTNAKHGFGNFFISEADESDGSFLNVFSFGAILTNIDSDHLDYWKNKKNLKKAFIQFSEQMESKKHFFWCKDDPDLDELMRGGFSYGFSLDADVVIEKVTQENFSVSFDISFQNKLYKDISLPLIGKHNVLNATAVFALCLSLGIEEAVIRKALLSFQGVGRRLTKIGSHQRVDFFDDYAHHPTAIRETLFAIKSHAKERRVVALFQPHRFSRLQSLFEEFSKCFAFCDELIITDVFSAHEKPIDGVNSLALLEKIKNSNNKISLRYIPKNELETTVPCLLQPHDLFISLGAGDITYIAKNIYSSFANKHKKLTVGVLFGGESGEHEVSIVSAKYIYECLDSSLYNKQLFYISKSGKWSFLVNSFDDLQESDEKMPQDVLSKLLDSDLVFPVLHGPCGEDGMVQGFLDTLGLPYVGCDYQSSSLCMNKSLAKFVAISGIIATSPFISVMQYEWKEKKSQIVKKVSSKLAFPLFVKPVHLGSSLGIQKVEKQKDLTSAIEEAFVYDDCIVIEQKIWGQEIEFSVLGNDQVEVSIAGEILANNEFYSYDRKYIHPMQTQIPANISKEKVKEGQILAKNIYRLCGCKGMARVDFFLDQEKKFWFNEINPIPGFTPISVYPKNWEKSGVSGKELVNKLVILALHRSRTLVK